MPKRLPYKDVTGGVNYSEGIGIALIRLKDNGKIYPIAPVYINPKAPRNTFSLSALKRFCGFRRVQETMMENCEFKDDEGVVTKVPCYFNNGLDYMDIEIVKIKPRIDKGDNPNISQLTQVSRNNMTMVEKLQEAHIRLGHVSFETIIRMAKKGTIEGLSQIEKSTPMICRTCFQNNRKRIPRNPTDTTRPPLMSRFSIDFMFYSHLSLRGHNSAFTIVDQGSRYPFAFPCCAKRPPVSIMIFFISCLRNMGFTPIAFKMDEGGELCKSTEFCKTLTNMGVIIHSTGGDNKTSNGLVERFHQTLHSMNRSSLSTLKALLPAQLPKGINVLHFWDLCLSYMVQIKRILINATLGESPYFIVFKRRPKYKDYPTFGSPCEIVITQREKLISTSKSGIFVGKGNNTGAFLVWSKDNPYKIIRAHHVRINEGSIGALFDGIFTKGVKDDPRSKETIIEYTITSRAFQNEDTHQYEIELPMGDSPMGVKIIDDEAWNIPMLETCIKDTPAFRQIPPSHRRNMHIVSVNGVEPITAENAISLINGARRLRSEKVRKVTIQLCKRKSRTRTKYEEYRAMFDTFRPILASFNAVICSHQAVLPSPPEKVRFEFQAYAGKFKKQYQAATIFQFEKNAGLYVYGMPLLIKDLQKDAVLLKSVMAPSVKKSHDIDNMYIFKMRHTLNGKPMKQGLHFEESYSPTCSLDSVKCGLALAASKTYKGCGTSDVDNSFQTIIRFIDAKETRKFATVPRLFQTWFEKKYNVKFPGPAKECAIPLFTNMQGQRDAGRLNYDLIRKVLIHYGFIRSPVDYGCFSKPFQEGIGYVFLSTDDFLGLFPTMDQFDSFTKQLKEYFSIKIQKKSILHFLNMRITVSEKGISLDQTESIIDFSRKYWGHPDKLKKVHTPFRVDKEYEKELAASLPASPPDLKLLEKQYGGSYRSIYGSLLYFVNVTRLDLMYAMCRLGKYTAAPTSAAFVGLRRICRYLATKPHRPLYYPANPTHGTNMITFAFGPNDTKTIEMSNDLTCFNDAGDTQDLMDQRSILCNTHILGGTCVAWETKKSPSIPLHSTDSEIRSNSRANQRTKILRHFLTSVGHVISEPIPIYQDNQAVNAIVKASRITPRTKYLGIHAGYCQQEQERGNTHLDYLPTKMMMADVGTKALPGPQLNRFSEWGIGVRFYPPKDHKQYAQMKLEWYDLTYLEIEEVISSSTP